MTRTLHIVCAGALDMEPARQQRGSSRAPRLPKKAAPLSAPSHIFVSCPAMGSAYNRPAWLQTPPHHPQRPQHQPLVALYNSVLRLMSAKTLIQLTFSTTVADSDGIAFSKATDPAVVANPNAGPKFILSYSNQ